MASDTPHMGRPIAATIICVGVIGAAIVTAVVMLRARPLDDASRARSLVHALPSQIHRIEVVAIGDALELEPRLIDLGPVPPGSQIVADLHVFNRTDHRLEFANVTTTCGCTTGHLESDSVAPGRDTSLRVQVEAPVRLGATSRQTVRLIRKDHFQPLAVAISCTVASPIHLAVADFDEQGRSAIEAVEEDAIPFRIVTAKPDIFGSLPTTSAARHDLTVLESIYREKGRPREVLLKLDHPDIQTLSVPMSVLREGASSRPQSAPRIETSPAGESRLYTTPRRIDFGLVRPGVASEQTLTVLGVDGMTEPTLHFLSHNAQIEVALTALSPRGLDITLRMTSQEGYIGHLSGQLRISIGDSFAITEVRALAAH